MTKPLASILISIVSLVALAACGGGGQSAAPAGENTAAGQTAPASSQAAEPTTQPSADAQSKASDFEFSDLDDGSLQVYGYTGPGGVVEVPAEVDGKPVSGIAREAFRMNDDITELRIPDGILEIEQGAIYDMEKLTKLSFGSGITLLESETISTNPALVWLQLPDTLEVMEEYAVIGNSVLEQVHAGDAFTLVDHGNFYPNNDKLKIYGPAGTLLAEYCQAEGYSYVAE